MTNSTPSRANDATLASTMPSLNARLRKGETPDTIYLELAREGVYWVDDDGHIRSKYSDGPLGGKASGGKSTLYISTRSGRANVRITAPRLAFMIHTKSAIPDGWSVLHTGSDAGDFREQNLMLCKRGQEQRIQGLLRDGAKWRAAKKK